MNFSDLCTDRSHHAVHYDLDGYMKCDLDKKYVYSDGRKVTFTKPRDRRHFELTKRRLEVVFGKSGASYRDN